MIAQPISMSLSDLNVDLLATSWLSLVGLTLSLALVHAYGFDPSAWM